MSIKVDPNFDLVNNPYIYVYWSTGGSMRISRFTHTNNNGGQTSKASMSSEFAFVGEVSQEFALPER